LSLLLVLFRQLKAVVTETPANASPTAVADVVDTLIGPAFLPLAPIATLLVVNLEHPDKPNQLRAADVLGAAARLLASLPTASTSTSSHTNFLVPLFQATCRSGVFNRTNLIILSAIVDRIPPHAVPDGTLEALLRGLTSNDSPNTRSTVIVSLLSKRRGMATSEHDRHMLEPLRPYFDPSDNPPIVMTNLTRYTLPSLFKVHPTALAVLLDMLGSPKSDGTELFAAWILVASLGVSHGLLSTQNLPPSSLQEAMAHEDPLVRLRAFELITGSKDVLQLLSPAVIDLVRDSLRLNAVLPSAG
jgi:hypothetical protein